MDERKLALKRRTKAFASAVVRFCDCDVTDESLQPIWREADELIAIFVTIARNTRDRIQIET